MVIQDVRSEVDNKRFLKGVLQSQQSQMDKLGGELAKVYDLKRHMADGSSKVEFSNALSVRPAFFQKRIFLNGRKKAILLVLYVMTNHKHCSISYAPVSQLLEMGDTPSGTTEFWKS